MKKTKKEYVTRKIRYTRISSNEIVKKFIKTINPKYRAILIKCAILNICVLFGTTSAMAFAPYESTYYRIEQGTGGDITNFSINGTDYRVSYTNTGSTTSS